MERLMRKNPAMMLLFKAVLTAFIVSAILLFITSAIMSKSELSAGVVSTLVIVTYIVSNLLCGVILGKTMEQKKFMWGLYGGLLYFAIIFIFSLVITGTKDFNLFTTVKVLMICGLSGMFGGMIS